MRLRSTESLLLRIWRRCVLTCRQFWPIRPSSYSSSRLCRPSLLSSWRSTSHHHLHRSDIQGSSLTLYFFFLTSGDTGSFVWGGDILFEDYFLCFVYRYFGFVVLVLVVYSIFSFFFAYWLCFVFSIAYSCRWCLGLVLVFFASHSHVNESSVSCLCV